MESIKKKEYYFRNTDFVIEIVKVKAEEFLLTFSSKYKKLESYDYADYTKAELHFHMICDVVLSTLNALE